MNNFNLYVLLFASSFLYATSSLTHLEQLEFSGRWDKTGAYPVSQWSGSNVKFAITSTSTDGTVSVALTIDSCTDNCHYFLDVEKDGSPLTTFEVNAATQTVQWEWDLGSDRSTSEFKVTKKTESASGDAQGIFSISDVHVQNGFLSPPVAATKKKKMLVVGDSITAAYGVDGPTGCSFSAQTENAVHSYASLTAAQLGLELSIVAWSGKGVVRNYGDANPTSPDPMPLFYNRTLGAQPLPYWDPLQFQADIVVVTLGSNDYSTEPHPSDEDFLAGYAALLAQISLDYPRAQLLCVCEPAVGGNEEANVQTAAQRGGAQYLRVPDSIYDAGTGCNGHPNAAAQQAIAAVVAPKVKEMLY